LVPLHAYLLFSFRLERLSIRESRQKMWKQLKTQRKNSEERWFVISSLFK
jgi:hypothetical protein